MSSSVNMTNNTTTTGANGKSVTFFIPKVEMLIQ